MHLTYEAHCTVGRLVYKTHPALESNQNSESWTIHAVFSASVVQQQSKVRGAEPPRPMIIFSPPSSKLWVFRLSRSYSSHSLQIRYRCASVCACVLPPPIRVRPIWSTYYIYVTKNLLQRKRERIISPDARPPSSRSFSHARAQLPVARVLCVVCTYSLRFWGISFLLCIEAPSPKLRTGLGWGIRRSSDSDFGGLGHSFRPSLSLSLERWELHAVCKVFSLSAHCCSLSWICLPLARF